MTHEMQKGKKFGLSYNAVIRRLNRNTGEIIDEERVHNIVTNAGLERMAYRLFEDTESYFNSIAIGTGTTAAAAGDTALETEVTRAAATLSYVADYQAKFEKVFTFASGDSYNITEAGIFDSATASGSTMFNHLVFSAKAVDVNTSLSVTITITVGRV